MTWSVQRAYGEYPQIEDEFEAALDGSLAPRGPEFLYELVGGLGLAPGAVAVDVGCGDGTHARRLAERFGFTVTAVDPVVPEDTTGIGFAVGTAERIPVPDGSADLVWCRDVLVHVADLDRAYAEIRRVLRPDGSALVYQMFGTDLLEPGEAARLWSALGVVPRSADRAVAERTIAAQGLRVVRSDVLGSEWGERDGKPARKLLHAARLIRDRDRWVERFGADNYEIKLADCLWHVYAMIGKLSRHVYVLARRP